MSDEVAEFIDVLTRRLSEASGIPIDDIKVEDYEIEEFDPPGGEIPITIAGITIPFSISAYMCGRKGLLIEPSVHRRADENGTMRCYFDHIEFVAHACGKIQKAKEKIKQLKAEIEDLRYRPGGPGYVAAKTHYESMQE